MPWRIWLSCDRNDVDHIKNILKTNDKLEKKIKIKTGANQHEKIIPTTLQSDEEPPSNTDQRGILQQLGLKEITPSALPQIKWLPSASEIPTKTTSRPATMQDIIQTWLESLPTSTISDLQTTTAALIQTCPQKYTIYDPMVLLPQNAFQSPPWRTLLQTLNEAIKTPLWKSLLKHISHKTGAKTLSHLAINSKIPYTTQTSNKTDRFPPHTNILRSPSPLIILHGDFGPSLERLPSETDFRHAFWVTVRQNGLFQTWAPRYTMFSRGNIKEKARILGFDSNNGSDKAVCEIGYHENGFQDTLIDAVAVDLYAGIGYFAFSYVVLGMECVLCWEINPWSVEGLRRGAVMNGWKVCVLRGKDLGLELGMVLCDRPRLVVLEESNERAGERMREIRDYEMAVKKRVLGDVIHVNCGFLPSSQSVWWAAWQMVCKHRRAWLHLHENVGWNELDAKKREIAAMLEEWPRAETDVHLHHVELVKTFAPDVWHCVFDIYIAPARADGP